MNPFEAHTKICINGCTAIDNTFTLKCDEGQKLASKEILEGESKHVKLDISQFIWSYPCGSTGRVGSKCYTCRSPQPNRTGTPGNW